QSREILEATAESRKKEKAKASEEEKAYKEADRNYYLASVLNSRLEEKIEQEKQKLGEAESKESEARKGVVKKVREARTTTKASVKKDENGEYHYSLNGDGNNAEEQKSFWEKEEILEHEVIADEVITAGELELEKWLSRMLDNEDYFLNILISAVAKKEDIDTFFTSLNKSSNFGELDSYYKEAVIGLFVSNDYVYKGEDVAASILMMNSDSVYSKVVNDLVSNYVTKLASIYVVYKLNQYALFSNFSKYYTLAAYQCWTGSVHNYETSMQKLRTTFQEYTKRREEREKASKEYYKVLYGQEEKPAEKLSGREIRKDLKAAFSEYRDFTEDEIDAVLGKLGEEESFTDRIEAMNIALERFYADYKNKKEALEESLAEKAKLQAEAAEEYNREVQAELQIKD
ncbi:MAG: hypothetical protein UHO11_11180, partial [Treponema sp.]|nr:hypothetical protein [Treponema sp.]